MAILVPSLECEWLLSLIPFRPFFFRQCHKVIISNTKAVAVRNPRWMRGNCNASHTGAKGWRSRTLTSLLLKFAEKAQARIAIV